MKQCITQATQVSPDISDIIRTRELHLWAEDFLIVQNLLGINAGLRAKTNLFVFTPGL
jgi:hypothetical protein